MSIMQRRKAQLSSSTRVEHVYRGKSDVNNKKSNKIIKRILATMAALATVSIVLLVSPKSTAPLRKSKPLIPPIVTIKPAHEIPPRPKVNIDIPMPPKPKITVDRTEPIPITEPEKDIDTDISNGRKLTLSDPVTIKRVRDRILSVRKEFAARYGGEKEAADMLKRGVRTSGTSHEEKERGLRHTAERILLAALRPSPKFTMSFGGYSVTVGRGNHFSQSYPFVLQKILSPVFLALHDTDLVVRNGAIGGIPSFPYGWCLPNFLGADSDVVGWDYGMNEGGGAGAFEAYVRQSMVTMPNRPMMVMLDTKRARVDLLRRYHENGALLDSIAVGRGEVVDKRFLEAEEGERPEGFRNWDQWGSPPGSPGQSKWHPKYMEHELIAWMMAVHFLDPLERALGIIEDGFDIDYARHGKPSSLPEPTTGTGGGNPDETVPFLLYGKKVGTAWQMDHVSCRTSFLPNIEGHLSSIVVSGAVKTSGDDLSSRDDEEYKKGWVSDVGKVERETKRNVEKIGGLGYIDMKLALYGSKESGTLRLWLPHPSHDVPHSHRHSPDDTHTAGIAMHWFESLVFCEVNEKRGKSECKMTSDMSFVVGGVPAVSVVQITDAASYLGKHICVNVKISPDAKTSARKDVEPIGDGEGRMGTMEKVDGTHIGLTVDIAVTSKYVSRENGACSISHVVWQSI